MPSLAAFTLYSPEFKDLGKIPAIFTCHGSDTSPALSWNGAPEGSRSLVLAVEDPDAPMGTWVHWVVYNIPASVQGFARGMQQGQGGTNSWGKQSYGGPCPPSGVHHYIFTLYALDAILNLPANPSLKEIKTAMAPHILGEAKLTGLYP